MLKQANREDLERIKREWVEQADAYGDEGSVFANDTVMVIDKLIVQTEEQDHAAYILSSENGEARALLHIVHALPNSNKPWLKLFDMELGPKIAFAEEGAAEIGETIASAVFEPITLLFTDYSGAKELKIYGRTEAMRRLFYVIAQSSALKHTLKLSDISCHKAGNWLVFRKN